ncbi:MAG: GGDEF and EAL domain-containing protein [Roseburia sp.]|nr:GGDEF and EAL domain-containing protein [Roseburia sp.]
MKLSMEEFEQFIEIMNPCIDDYLYIYDLKNDVYHISANALERFDLPSNRFHHVSEILGQLVWPTDFPALQKDLGEIQDNKKLFHNMEYRWVDRNGKPVWINCRGEVLCDRDGKAEFLAGCVNEIGRNQKADNVSGLMRESALYSEIDEKEDIKKGGFILRVGIDNFKEINEGKGVKYGDMILQKTAECIEKSIAEGQKLYRLVADEFAIIDFTGRGMEDAKMLYRRISWQIGRFIEDNQYEVFYTVSGGIVNMKDVQTQNYDNVMQLAEFALNQAKNAGKNQYYIYNEKDYESFLHDRWLIQIMRKAINHNFEGFEAYFQPIVDIATQRVAGAETLLRFRTEETGMIPPKEFISLLEESGLIVPVGRWVLYQAMDACSKIREIIPDFRISVNVSYIQVLKSDVLKDILDGMKRYQIPPENLMVEITESGLLEENHRYQRFCNGIKDNGILLALDDFGTGYSNFHYLYHLNPNTIKIDRSFTVQAIRNENEYNLLHHMAEMTHGIDLKLCIEGVETEEELGMICGMKPDYIQGYYFGRPSPLADFMTNHVNKVV